jgi:CelD/BcsL family acetyltransferase involved in cellulose biosynthesis
MTTLGTATAVDVPVTEFTATAKLSVRCLQAADLTEDDHAAWLRLYQLSGTSNPFLHPAWALATQRHRTAGTRLWLVQVRAGAELVAVAALELASPIRGLPGVKVLRGAGSHEYSGLLELPGILALPRFARCGARAVVEYLASRRDEWSWWHVPLGEHDSWFESDWLPAGQGFVVTHRLIRAEVVLDVAADDRLRSRNLRESVRRARNRLTRDFGSDWAVTRVVDQDRLGLALDNLVRLHRERSALAGHPRHEDRIATARIRDYLGEVVAAQADGGASCYELRASGALIAQLLTFHGPSSTYCSLSGLTATAWQYSPTTLLQWHAYQDTRVDGRRVFSLSTGPDRAKLRWSRELRISPEFVVTAPRWQARLAYAVYAQASHAARLFRDNRRQLATADPA